MTNVAECAPAPSREADGRPPLGAAAGARYTAGRIAALNR